MHFLYVISVFLLIHLNQAQTIQEGGTSDCSVVGISEDEWNGRKVFDEAVEDIDVNKIIFKGNYTNIKGSRECAKYFCIQLNDAEKIFEIIPSENFANIDGNGDNERTIKDTVEIISSIDLECTTGTRKLTFNITVKDTNNHAPLFNEKSYSYTLPMPMSPKNSITNFGKDITVTDVDFSNKEISFSSDFDGASDFEGLYFKSSYGKSGSYSYILEMEFSKVEKLKSSKTFTLTATDSGKPAKSSTATVTINIDEENSEPPSFTQPSYVYDYDKKNSEIVPRDGQKTMLESSMKNLQCSIKEDNYSPFFGVDLDGEEVKLSLLKPFDDDTIAEQMLQVTIQCFVSEDIGTSNADVIISFPKGTIGFSKKKFSAQYEITGDIHKVTMTDLITLTGKLVDIDITVEEDLQEYFEVKSVEGGWTLGKKINLDQEWLKNIEINIIIALSKKNYENPLDEAFITLVLPNGEDGVEFTQSFFTGDYIFDDDNKGIMNPIPMTLNNNNFDIVDCGLEKSSYSTYFKPSCDDSTKLELNLGSDIPKDLLLEGAVPLSMWLKLKMGTIERKTKTAILLNLSYKGKTTETPSTTKSSSTTGTSSTTETSPTTETEDCSHTGWIIAVIVLLLLFIVYVIVSVIYYVKRLRNRTEADSYSTPRRHTQIMKEPFTKKRTSDKFKDISTRRPTGFIRYNPDQDGDSLDSEYADARNEVNNNTNQNKFMNDPGETFRKLSDGGNNGRRNIGFDIPPPPPFPETFNLN